MTYGLFAAIGKAKEENIQKGNGLHFLWDEKTRGVPWVQATFYSKTIYVIYCYVTNYPKISNLTHIYYLTISVGQILDLA